MSPLTPDERALYVELLRDVACTHGSVRIILRRQLAELADRLEAEPEPREISDEAVRVFGQALIDYGYDVATFTRVSPTEVRYEQAGTTPAVETVRGGLAAALALCSVDAERERDEVRERADTFEMEASMANEAAGEALETLRELLATEAALNEARSTGVGPYSDEMGRLETASTDAWCHARDLLAGAERTHTLVPNEHLDRAAAAWRDEDVELCEAYMKDFASLARGENVTWPTEERGS